jgi:hypothetical protein
MCAEPSFFPKNVSYEGREAPPPIVWDRPHQGSTAFDSFIARLEARALEKDCLILKRAALSWCFDVLANGEVVGRIFKASAAPVGSPWMWVLGFGHHEGRTPTHGYAATREAAMAAFAKSWRRE